MGKVYTRFQSKRRKNPTRWGGTYLYSLYKRVPPLDKKSHSAKASPFKMERFISKYVHVGVFGNKKAAIKIFLL